MTHMTDLELGVWMLRHCALSGESWAAAVLAELERLQRYDRNREEVNAWLDTESSEYQQAMTNEVLR